MVHHERNSSDLFSMFIYPFRFFFIIAAGIFFTGLSYFCLSFQVIYVGMCVPGLLVCWIGDRGAGVPVV